MELDLALRVIDVVLWISLAVSPEICCVALVSYQLLLVVTETDPGIFTLESAVMVGFLAYGTSRILLFFAAMSTLVFVLIAPTLMPGLQEKLTFGVVWVGFILGSLLIGFTLRRFAARREGDLATIDSLEESTRAALAQQRKELARELHDIVAHDLTIITMQANTGLITASDEGARATYLEIRGAATSGLDNLRRLLQIMREPHDEASSEAPPADRDVQEVVAELVEHLRGLGHQVRCAVEGDLEDVPDGVRTSVLRVLREGVTNILKHAPERAGVSVRVEVAEGTVMTAVTNTLERRAESGLHSFPPSSLGLIGLRERVQLLGGQLTAGPTTEGVFRLRAEIPLRSM